MMKVPSGTFEREPVKRIPKHLMRGAALIIIAHARLEYFLTELEAELLRIDNPLERQIRSNIHNTRETFLTIQRLIDMWNIQTTENLNRLRKDIEHAAARRNEVAHGIWLRIKPGVYRLRITKGERQTNVGPLDRRIIPQASAITAKSLRRDAVLIYGVTERVRALKKHVSGELKAWRKIIPSRLPRPSRRPRAGHKGKAI
jgi:hypothetical protein